MYLSYYGLYKEPFHITPDPAFLFESPSHKEAYAAIVYGVEQRKGFVAVTGEVGTGKTTVVRSYLDTLDKERVQPVYVFNPDVSFDELLRTMLRELGVEPEGKDQAWMLQWLHWTLIKEYKDNRGILLVVDEAQNMPVETLEKLRMLSNLETTEEKLLQIVLVGQPELDDKLNLHQLRQLKQRLAVRATLRPLSMVESLAYVRHRFERAGGEYEGIFSPGAIKTLARLAKGSPRSLNILCDNVLLAGFGAEQRPIGAALVKEVARDLEGRRPAWSAARVRWALGAAAAGLLLAGGLGGVMLAQRGGEVAHAEGGALAAGAKSAAPASPTAEPALPAAEPMVVAVVSPAAPPEAGEAAASVEPVVVLAEPEAVAPAEAPALAEIVTSAVAPVEEKVAPEAPAAPAVTAPDAPAAPAAPVAMAAAREPDAPTAPAVTQAPVSEQLAGVVQAEPEAPVVPKESASPPVAEEVPVTLVLAADTPVEEVVELIAAARETAADPAEARVAVASAPVTTAPKAAPAVEPVAVVELAAAEEPATAAPRPVRPRVPRVPAGPGEVARVVASGENLTRLVTEMYGRCDERLLRIVQERNPFVTDVDMILTGEKLVFPTIDGAEPGGLAAPDQGS